MSIDSPVFLRRLDAEAGRLATALAGAAVKQIGPHEFEADVRLPVGVFRRRIPMRLLLHGACHAGASLTLAELLPQRSGRRGRAYFAAGNRLLDRLREAE